MKRNIPRRRLQLTSTTLRVLSPAELDAAQGGYTALTRGCDTTILTVSLVSCKTIMG